ncbi:MAG: 50S ribosomal protein L24e [Candidatus Woesearchaeota archaeon]|nr:MAG: 50S ribosomal protein L24e [Candidatus Woesearchaeota archaeon]
MAECSFCNKEIEKGKGTMYVKETGKVLWFCSSKCEKHMLKLKRESRKTKWVK